MMMLLYKYILCTVALAIERESYVGLEGGEVEVCMIVSQGRIVVGVRIYLHISTICKLIVTCSSLSCTLIEAYIIIQWKIVSFYIVYVLYNVNLLHIHA